MPRQNASALAVLCLITWTTVAWGQTADELYASGVKMRQSQHFAEAVELFQRALALNPENSDVLVQLGFAELGGGNLEPARQAFSKALSLAPDYSDAKFGLAQIEFRSGNLDAALALAEPLARDQPDNAEVAGLLTNIQNAQKQQQNKTARKAAEKATRKEKPSATSPDAVAVLMEEGRKLRTSGSLAGAERAYRKALRLAPANTDVLVALALTEAGLGKFEEAARSLDAALKIRPGLVDARLGQVRLAMWHGDTARARALIVEVLASAPNNSEALALDARIALLAGQHEQAARTFERAADIDPRNVEALVGLGDVRRAQGDDIGSREAYRQALALQPGAPEIAARLALPPPRKWRIDMGSEISELSMGRGTWTDSAVGIAYQANARTTVSARTRLATRYGQTDVQIEGRIDRAFLQAFSAYVLAAATPSSDFLARYAVGAGASWQAIAPRDEFGPLLLNIDLRHDAFANTTITTISPWLQAYFLNGRVGLSARWVHAFDNAETRADGYVLRGDVVVTPRLSIFAGYGDAPEIDDGTLIPTRTVFGGASFNVSDDLTLRASIAHEQRPTFDRNIFALGVTKRF